MEHENDSDTKCNWCIQYSHQRIGIGTGRIGNKNSSGDHPNVSTVKIGQNTEKIPGDLRKCGETCCHSNSTERPSPDADVKTLKGVK